MKNEISNNSENEYIEILNTAITQINVSRNAIALQINSTVSTTYWNLGKLLHDKKIEGGYGSNIINRLSVDLKDSFPDMGLSPRNLWNMKLFYERYAESDKKLLQAVAVLQWGHNLLLINKKLSDEEVYFYATESVSKNWNRDLLLNAIKMNTFSVHKNELRDNNFSKTLPTIQAQQANEILKDRYNLGFLGVTEPIAEIELEKRLIERIKLFMLELGKGFAFIGNQFRLEYNNKEYFVDLLFSNRKLNCLVAIDLKIGEFKSEYIGKMNMYLSLLDKLEKEETENQSIGIILCAEKDHLDVELALQDVNKPIAVSDYELLIPKQELQTLVLNEMKCFDYAQQPIKKEMEEQN
ncbi:MAG: PDDEXK nuclease domain-containing protein [Spirochaetota bacterium]|nr:PDDEXK nuclease domain-containing protein [Spirochaetota bacterium]